ncbi:PREDICTED: homeobox protein knotted-1-like 2 [Lupinus angustifolius]|uniref:homeobox protein knotted-1-like 2 n=1 Tax=Lupinus angustifolius TaxID=3871 RepID=UPI00092EF296|nr:PREDICTED: homeobox protein knotted-1-like 2 [Lupinus angustifolius]
MEEYTNNNNHIRENTGQVPRENFLYTTAVGDSSGGNHHHHNQFPINTFHLQSGGSGHSFQPDQVRYDSNVKTESNNNTSQQLQTPIFHYPLLRGSILQPHQTQHGGSHSSNEVEEDIKAKIIAHPQYSNLLQVYMDCQKVGAPPEVVARMAAAQQDFEARQRSSVRSNLEGSKDPELDQFMEAYYDMLVKYRDELTRPIQEAMDFMQKIETQLNTLCNGNGPLRIFSGIFIFLSLLKLRTLLFSLIPSPNSSSLISATEISFEFKLIKSIM